MSHLDEGTLHALLDGELETTEVAEIQAHLGSCSACGLRLREAKEFLGEADRMIAAVDMGPGVRPPVLPPRTETAAAPPPRVEAPVEPPAPRPRPRPRPPLAEQPPLVPPELRSEQAVILIPDNESPAERRMRRIRRLGWAAMVAVIVGSASVWAGKFGVRIGATPDTLATPAQVVSPQETSPVERQAFTGDTSPVAVAAKAPPRRQAAPAAPAESSLALRKKPAPARPAAPEPKLAASAPAAQDSAVPADSTSTATDSSADSSSQAPATDSAATEDLADVRARASEALAQLDREKRRNQAAAATAALDSEKRRRAREVTQPAAGTVGARAAAVPTPPAPPTLEQRARVYLRIGLDEASRQLGGPAHVIEGMSPIFMGLAQGGVVAGADGTRPVVRVVYQDAQGRLIMLDQQRIRPGQPTPKGSQVAWTQGEVAMWLDGEVNPEVFRTLRPRVR
jgi:anti-sigma factor RsiW